MIFLRTEEDTESPFFPDQMGLSDSPPVSVPPDWNPTACWKGRMLESPDYFWEAEAGRRRRGSLHTQGGTYLPLLVKVKLNV